MSKLILICDLKQVLNGVLPSYGQCVWLFTMLKEKSHFFSFKALFTWQTIYFLGVSLISWIYFDPMYWIIVVMFYGEVNSMFKVNAHLFICQLFWLRLTLACYKNHKCHI